MATRPCPHCGERIQNAAVLCRFCRQKVPKLADTNPAILYGVGGFMLLVGIVAGVAAVVRRPSASAQRNLQPVAHALPAPNPQPDTAPPPISPAVGDHAPAMPVATTAAEALTLKVLKGALSDGDLKTLVIEATANRSITYAHLKKNTDRYKWKPWRLYGRIVEISERDGTTRGRVSLSDWQDQVLFFEYPGETDFVQNNVVEMVGVLASTFDYTSQAGWNISIPAIAVAAITKRGGIDKLGGIKHRRSSDDDDD